MSAIRSSNDFQTLYVGRVVRLKTSPQPFLITGTNEIYTEDGPIDSPVTLITVDQMGRPHTITVSAYCLVTDD